MKTRTSGSPLDALDELAPGVLGYAIEHEGALYIPLVQATREGSGDVGRFLDDLPPDRIIKFPCVINPKLAGMLARRGFVEIVEPTEDGDAVEVFVRSPAEHRPEGSRRRA